VTPGPGKAPQGQAGATGKQKGISVEESGRQSFRRPWFTHELMKSRKTDSIFAAAALPLPVQIVSQ
jgi:hypothetical protein